jgi:hypothetical protein
MSDVRAQVAASRETAHVYGQTQYAARSWAAPRRIIIKAEVVHLAGRDPRDNAPLDSSSRISGKRRGGSTSRCSVAAARSKTGS